ncbi:MAG: M50 family metallopeptidase [Rhabdochlamydiaceae bacterium]
MHKNLETAQYKPEARKNLSLSLEPGDTIVAVDGEAVMTSFDLLAKLQSRKALIIVDRSHKAPVVSWTKSDAFFENSFQVDKLSQMIESLASTNPQSQLDNLHLLAPVVLKAYSELPLDPKIKAQAEARFEAYKKQIEKIEDPEVRAQQFELLAQSQKTLMLGVELQDRLVSYNPTPFVLFGDVVDQTWRTLINLVSGSLSPKNLAGPVGIVQALQYSWQSGLKDALFWLGFVSLNLAFINLLPIPVLDGGHILFSIIEGLQKDRSKPKPWKNSSFHSLFSSSSSLCMLPTKILPGL